MSSTGRFATVWLFLLVCASAQTAPTNATSGVPQDENARKARGLIDKAIAALGGEAYLSLKNKSEEGRFYSFHHGNPNSEGIIYGAYNQFPDKDRLEILHLKAYHILWWTVGNIPVKDKSDVVIIHNGEKATETTYKGTAKEEPVTTTAFLRRRQHSLDWALRKWINEPGVAFFYEGSTVAAQKPCEQVTIMNKTGDSVTLFFDQDTHLPVKKSYSWRDPQDKLRNVEDEVYDGYKLVQGIQTPHSITRYQNGDMSFQRFLNVVTYNQDLPANLFDATVTYDARSGPKER